MAKTVKKTARNLYFLFRLVGLLLVLVMLWPVMRLFGNVVNGNGKKHKQASGDLSDSLFAPLVEKISKAGSVVPRVWADHT